jgi:phospholipase/carboxylesterase
MVENSSQSQQDGAQLITGGAALAQLGLIHRVRVPGGSGPHPALVMVHGKDGTEDVTWIFARAAGPEWLIVSPRAPYAGENGGYRWTELPPDSPTSDSTFDDGLAALEHFIHRLPTAYAVDTTRLVLLGFSQGAAMVYAYAAAHVRDVRGVVGLAGFVPPHVAKALPDLQRLPVLLLHGTRDETVPIEIARANRDQLAAANAEVRYHESEVGHKVSTAGLAELRAWLRARLTEKR